MISGECIIPLEVFINFSLLTNFIFLLGLFFIGKHYKFSY